MKWKFDFSFFFTHRVRLQCVLTNLNVFNDEGQHFSFNKFIEFIENFSQLLWKRIELIRCNQKWRGGKMAILHFLVLCFFHRRSGTTSTRCTQNSPIENNRLLLFWSMVWNFRSHNRTKSIRKFVFGFHYRHLTQQVRQDVHWVVKRKTKNYINFHKFDCSVRNINVLQSFLLFGEDA